MLDSRRGTHAWTQGATLDCENPWNRPRYGRLLITHRGETGWPRVGRGSGLQGVESEVTGIVRLQDVVELIVLGLDGQGLLVIHERGVVESLVVLRPILHRASGWRIGVSLEGHRFTLYRGVLHLLLER